MQFCEISEEEFREFLNASTLQTFLQTPEIGKLRKKGGWNVDYVGVKQDKKLVAATMLVSKKNFMNSYEFVFILDTYLRYDITNKRSCRCCFGADQLRLNIPGSLLFT